MSNLFKGEVEPVIPKITLDLPRFLEIFFQDDKEQLDHKLCKNTVIANLISQLDKTEVYVHVEYPNADNHNLYPVIWRKVAWIPSYERWLRQKKESEERVRLWESRKKLIMKIAAALQFTSGMQESDAIEKASRWIDLNKQKAIDNVLWLCKEMGRNE